MNSVDNNLFSVQGEIAIVTGGTGHLGFAIAEGLSQHGATVVIAGRSKDKCDEKARSIKELTGNKCFGLEFDISSRESIMDGFEWVAREIGNFNILINNASYGVQNSLEKMTSEEWQIGIDGTVKGVFICIQEALPYLKKNHHQSSSIVNIASMYGMVSPNPEIYGNSGFDNPPNYGAGKAAIIQLTKYAACHLAQHNIRVNCISPGPFPKPNVQENEWFIEQLKAKTPLKRIGVPKEIKGAAVYLASNASSYVTGHNLVVDGGWTVW